MALLVEIATDVEQRLAEKAQALGLSAEVYAATLIERQVRAEQQPVWERIDEIMRGTSDAELDRLPADGASRVDEYLYGCSKR